MILYIHVLCLKCRKKTEKRKKLKMEILSDELWK